MPVGKRKLLIAAVLVLCVIICACVFIGRSVFTYTNLAASADRDFARSLLDGAGIARENTDLLLELVDGFYSTPYPGIADSGFRRGFIPLFSYSGKDAARHLDMQPDSSLTCRMAAFILLRDKLGFPDTAERKPGLEEKDPRSRVNLTDSADLLRYDLLFSNLEQPVRSSGGLADAVKEYWESSGITFPQNAEANIVTAYGSTGETIQNFHAAVVICSGDEIWLLEKYDPIYPYQLSRFTGEKQLVSYMKTRVSDVKYAAIFLGGDCLWTK